MREAVFGFGLVCALLLVVYLFGPSSPPPGYGYGRPWWKVLLGKW